VPVPVSVESAGELEALLTNEAVAEAAPVAPGVNLTVKDTGWLVVTFTGKDKPLIENSDGLVPPKLTEETTTFEPAAVKIPLWVPLVPSTTAPTLIELLALNVLWVVVTPAPVRDTFRSGFEASEATETLPLKVPVDCAVNVTLNDAVCAGASVTGVDSPETLNPFPLTEIWEICVFDAPVFVIVLSRVALFPACTFPKFTLLLAAVSWPTEGVGEDLLNPWQPKKAASVITTSIASQRLFTSFTRIANVMRCNAH
jgi:hypothetical protein